ncbi:MAG: hypothetical protein IPL04_06285 [Chitinophagaceae bacterium]|nr:hypothetical protein [Chitinophagaceae bacterium]
MERIESLINKLKEQFEQNADPTLMLGTAQLLQFELTKLKTNDHYSLGTPKVAVVLPSSNLIPLSNGEYEKYAPKPAAKNTEVKEVKETLLVDNGSVSVIQKTGNWI